MLTMLGHSTPKRMSSLQPVRLAGSFRYWFVKKYCWLVYVREKYCSSWKFTIVYDKPQPNEQAANMLYICRIDVSMWLFSLSALLSTLAMASPSPNKFGEVARYLPEFHASNCMD